MFANAFAFYDLFDKHAPEFSSASTYEKFCDLVNTSLTNHLRGYSWAPAVFRCAKAGKRTYHALTFPEANSFSDLFDGARFLPTIAR